MFFFFWDVLLVLVSLGWIFYYFMSMFGFVFFIREVWRDEVLMFFKLYELEKFCIFWWCISLICGSELNNIIGDRDGRGENEVG